MLYNFVKKYDLKKTVQGPIFIYYGRYKNFRISISFRVGFGNLVKVFGNFGNAEDREKAGQALKELFGMGLKYFKDYSIKDGSIAILLNKQLGAVKCEEFEFVLDKLHEVIGETEMVQPACEMCNSKENIRFAVSKEFTEPVGVCPVCANEMAKKYSADSKVEEAKPNNYGVGFLAGIVFSLGGVILWILLGMAGIIAGLAGFAIAFLMSFGYKKAGGKINKFSAITMIVLSLVMVIVADYLTLCVAAVTQLGVDFFDAFLVMPQAFAESSELLTAFLTDLAFGIVFTLLASINLFRSILQEAQKPTLTILE